MDLQYAYTILYVKDVPLTVSFYCNAFGFERKMMTPEGDYAELQSGPTTIAFANLELGASNFKEGFEASKLHGKPFGMELAFTSADVDAAMKKALDHGAVLLEAAVTKPWGQQVGYVRDINGVIVELCTPM